MKAEVKRGAETVELRAIVGRRWKVAALGFALPLTVAVGLALFLPSMYAAHTVVLVEPISEPGMITDDFAVRIDQLTRENLARPHLEAVIREHNISPVADDAAAAALRGDISVETQQAEQANGRVDVGITVSVRGRDPGKLAEVANALAAYYVDAESARQKADAEAATAELAAVRKQLDDEEARIKNFDDENLTELPEQVQVHLASISTLGAQLDAVRAARTQAMDRWHALSRPAPSHPAPAVDDDTAPAVPATVAADPELAQAEAQLRDLRSRYTDAHPEVIRVRREIAALRARASSSPLPSPSHPRPNRAAWGEEPAPPTGAEKGELTAQIDKLDAQERDLQARIATAQQAALNAPRRAHERAALLPEVEAARESYEALLKHYQELELAHGGAGRNPFRVFEEAVAPTHPVAPNRLRLVILGFIVSLLLAGGAVWLAEQVDRTFHSARELHAFAGLPVIGTIPGIAGPEDWRASRSLAAGKLVAASSAVAAVLVVTWFWASGNETLVRLLIRKGNP